MSFDLHPVNRLNAGGAPEFVTSDPQKLLEAAILRFEAATGRKLSPSQVEMYLLEVIAYMLSVRGAEEQLAFENNFVAYARPDWLERIGAGRETHRLQPTPATTVLRFTPDPGITTPIRIPAGTGVSDGAGQVRFLTLDEALIAPGQDYADIRAGASETGPFANKFPAGSISALIDPLPGIADVQNITGTGGGAALENLDRYRARVALAFERIGGGLSYERYVADALAWNARCVDVAVERPKPGYVNLSPLMDDGLPNDEELASLLAVFNESNIHQGDYIRVFAPVPHEFSFTLHLSVDNPGIVPAAVAAVQKVLDGWAGQLAGYIAPSEIIRTARNIQGVLDADTPDLVFAQLPANAWRRCTGFTPDVKVL